MVTRKRKGCGVFVDSFAAAVIAYKQKLSLMQSFDICNLRSALSAQQIKAVIGSYADVCL